MVKRKGSSSDLDSTSNPAGKKSKEENKDDKFEVVKVDTKAKVQTEEDLGQGDVEKGRAKKSHRKRNKQHFKNLVQQMEFYFGDANLSKSRFMQELLQNGPWADLDVFLKFNKLTAMMEAAFQRIELDDLWKALSKVGSDLLEIREENGKKQIRRVKRLVPKDPAKEDACTIYVENVPPNATNDFLKEHFSQQYGPVAYVSLPRYKFNQHIKGFAFIEFENEESAKKALEAYGAVDSIPPDMDPEDLQSIQSFQKEQAVELGLEDATTLSDVETQEPLKAAKKRTSEKGTDNEAEVPAFKKAKLDNINASEQVAKKKRKRQNKLYSGEPEFDFKIMSSLHVMSKHNWKKLRNTYLNMQKKNMGQAKQRMRAWKQENSSYAVDETAEATASELVGQGEQQPTVKSELELVPNTVVQFTLLEPIDDRNAVKKSIRSAFSEQVKYVDAERGSLQYFVRCSSEAQAKQLASITCLGIPLLLSGNEEQTYWKKIQEHRRQKLQGEVKPQQKQRAKARLMVKIEEARNSHKYFTEDS